MKRKQKGKSIDHPIPGTQKDIRGVPARGRTQDAKTLRIGIVVSRFNHEVTQSLLSAALETLHKKGISRSRIEVVTVPGAFEIPVAVRGLIKTKKFSGIVALGAVIRGETPHFEYISRAVSQGLMNIAIGSITPVGFGILTTENFKQAEERASREKFNRGSDAVLAVLEMVNILMDIKRRV